MVFKNVAVNQVSLNSPWLWKTSCHSPGPSSDSDLTSLAVDTDSLAELDDGMASGRASPNQPQGGATNISSSCSPLLPSLHEHCSPSPTPTPGSSAPNPEVSRPGRTTLFSGSLKKAGGANSKDVKPDYLDRASEHICLAVQKEKEQDYQSAFSYYRSGVDLLLQGVQGEFEEVTGGEPFFLSRATSVFTTSKKAIQSYWIKCCSIIVLMF